jgi:S-adenosylmethionine hydrolase
MAALVAFVTDFGLADSYVMEMRAAVLARVPSARLLDVTHEVKPFDRVHAALMAERALWVLPRGAALVVVVDPGVGTRRRRIFAEREGRWLVGPDNGVLPIRRDRDRVWTLREELLVADPSVTTFDGRERFAPIAALLAAGLHPDLAGRRDELETECVLPADADWVKKGRVHTARGEVITVDRYGNAITSVRPIEGELRVISPARFAGPVRGAYGEVDRGQGLGLVGSSGRIELCVREGSSGLKPGDAVEVACDG